ncbi:hypothetical protein GYMLUDRAFT_182088 [Collybiopsis luxurians FD-317 M1]|uniref:Uncharacterized protein n=1 Tax=Collybiopsis luxurians FD-317 M1 TaxID=944289 RepID=A0A0D0B9L7_9AGAR|nr:hypothetical protein GYMLUDRAFT_182088 [Collybiopsis luxurians FD-317 M1]
MPSQYKPIAILPGPQDAVISLAFSAKAQFLAATGYSGIYIWELSATSSPSVAKILYMLFAPQNPRYIITCSAWAYFHKSNLYVLLLGSMQGNVILWNWSDTTKVSNRCSSLRLLYRVPPFNDELDEILCIDVHELETATGILGRVAVATANWIVSVWTLTSAGKFSRAFFTTLLDGFNPKTIHFCKDMQDILAFSFYGGKIIQLHYKTGAIKSYKSHGPGVMGSVALSKASDKFLAYTGQNFQLFNHSNLKVLKTFYAEIPLVLFPKHVVFGESENIVVGGSDQGGALVFDANTEEMIQRLEYPCGGLVQPVSVSLIAFL